MYPEAGILSTVEKCSPMESGVHYWTKENGTSLTVSNITDTHFPVCLSEVRAKVKRTTVRIISRPSRCGRGTRLWTAGLVLFAIVLFGAGPQLGSFDADRDGTPDVPVIVLNPCSDVSVFRGVSQTARPISILHAGQLPSAVVSELWSTYAGSSGDSGLGHSSFLSFCPLRC